MALTDEQKKALIKAYEPILYFHPDEPFRPVHARSYVESSALWVSQPAGAESRHQKENWGDGSSDQSFPRQPIIPKNGISTSSNDDVEGEEDTDGDGVNEWYLGHTESDAYTPYLLSSDNDRLLFMENNGWFLEDGVTADSMNVTLDYLKAQSKWLDSGLSERQGCWYHAEVETLNIVDEILLAIYQQFYEEFSPSEAENGFEAILETFQKLFENSYIIWYYFLHPVHLERTRGCEEIVGVGAHGAYEGDWQAVGVLVDSIRDLDDPDSYPDPLYVTYGSRARGLIEDLIPFLRQYMDLRQWSVGDPGTPGEVRRIGRHPKVFVSKGSHNLYSLTGPLDAPQLSVSAQACGATEEFDEQRNDVEESIDDAVATAVTIAKLAAGCGIGAVVLFPVAPLGCVAGAVVGGIAAFLESDSFGGGNADVDEGPSAEDIIEANTDFPPDEANYGLVIIPEDISGDFPDGQNAAEVREWSGTIDERIVDRETQPWWRPKEGFVGYQGRWGAMMQHDQYDRRSGMAFPDFKSALLLELMINLSEQ